MILSGATCALGALFLVGCSGDDTVVPVPDSGAHDGGLDATAGDGGVDASHDGGGDASPDASQGDASHDASTDGSQSEAGDASHDAPSEASAADCLTGTGADTFFTLNDTTKCVVGKYTVATPSVSSLTWGRHDGPLGFDGTNIIRYGVPATATGALTPTNTAVNVTGLPTPHYWGSQALDVPFFPSLSWTAIGYSGAGTGFPGEIIIVDGAGAVQKRYDVNGFFSETAVATSGGRLLYTGLSGIATATSTTSAGGLYAADTCGTAVSNPRLLPETDATCLAPFQVGTWQAGTSGPVAVDNAGNAFAILSTFGGNQEMRGFEHDTIARGAAAVAGTALFSIGGSYTSELAADGKAAYFQTIDTTTYSALDVQRVTYTVDSVQKTISGTAAATFLTMMTAGTSVALIVDPQNRLWVGVTNPAVGDAGPTTSTFFVIRDKQP